MLFNIKEEVIKNCEAIKKKLADTSLIDEEIEKVVSEIEVVTELTRRHIETNTQNVQNWEAFQKQYESFTEKYDELNAKYKELNEKKNAILSRADTIRLFIQEMKRQESAIAEFDDRLWQTKVKQVTVFRDGTMKFEFNNLLGCSDTFYLKHM